MKWFFIVFTAFLLGAQRKINREKFKQANSLVVPLQNALYGVSSFWEWLTGVFGAMMSTCCGDPDGLKTSI